MNKNQLLAFAAFITSLANDGECSTTTETAPAGDPPTTKRRGRPLGTATLPPADPVTPAEPEKTEDKPAGQTGGAVAGSKTIDDMRALIEPLIKAARGGEVKPIILKYAPTLAQMDAKDYPAFEKGIEALLY